MGVHALRAAPALAAVDPESASGTQTQKTTSDLLTDLTGDNKSNRLYAARALKQQLTHAKNVVEHAREGSLIRDEALANLDELEQRLPEASLIALDAPNIVAPAAEILALLGEKTAVPKLDELIGTETRKGVLKRLKAARASLDSSP